MPELDQLKAENAKLNRQLNLLLKAIGSDGGCCPNRVGLIGFSNCDIYSSCLDCWLIAFQIDQEMGR